MKPIPELDLTFLAGVERELRAGQRGAALEALLQLWRENRHPALADLATELGSEAARALPAISGRTRELFQQAWVDVANARRAADVPRLLDGLRHPPWTAFAARLDRLVGLPDDPRIGLALAQFVTEMPVNSSLAVSTWRSLLALIARTADARCRPLLQERLEAANSWGDLDRHIIRPTLAALIPALPEPAAILPGALAGVRDALSALRAGPPPSEAQLAPPRRAGRSEAELLSAIWAEPSDDALRRVYADWLLEQGQPRGPFIATQLESRPMTGVQLSKEKKLLKAHVREWLGPLEPVVDPKSVRFERGFLAAALPVFRTQQQRVELAAHAAWGTVRELLGFPGDSLPLIERNPLLGLERFELELGPPLVDALITRTMPCPRLSSLTLSFAPDLLRVARAQTLPACVELRLLSEHDGHADALPDTPLASRLSRLFLPDYPLALDAWLRLLPRLPALLLLDLRGDFSGTRRVRFRRATVEDAWRVEVVGMTHAVRIEGVLQPIAGKIEHVDLVLPGKWESLVNVLAKQLPQFRFSLTGEGS